MADLQQRRTDLLAYARSCLDVNDLHGCRDACVDLEVLDARIEERDGPVCSVDPSTICSFCATVHSNDTVCPLKQTHCKSCDGKGWNYVIGSAQGASAPCPKCDGTGCG